MLATKEYYSKQNTIVISISNARQRNMMVKSFSRHNQVFDLYNEPTFLQKMLDVPCYIRFFDYGTYLTIEDEIIKQYLNNDITTTPPLIVYGLDMKLYSHPLITDAIKVGADYCLQLYRRTRRRAKKEEASCF